MWGKMERGTLHWEDDISLKQSSKCTLSEVNLMNYSIYSSLNIFNG